MLGTDTAGALAETGVAIFGLGGVGSWCAESLVRSGVRRLMLVDSDRICPTNVNRQLMATVKTIGKVKVAALADRLREINPDVELDVRQKIYEEASADEFELERWDYVIDAIDSLECKARLIRHALSIPSVTLFASMGAALKMGSRAPCGRSSARRGAFRSGASPASGRLSAGRTSVRRGPDAGWANASARRMTVLAIRRSRSTNGVLRRLG